MVKPTRVLILLGACSLLSACEPVAVALLGAGASTALRYNIDGVAARTFTAPASEVRASALSAIERMGLTMDSATSIETGEVIYARAQNREIEVELEPITRQATRLRVTARGGSFFYDNATAVELVQQTGKFLDAAMAAKGAPASGAIGGTRASAN